MLDILLAGPHHLYRPVDLLGDPYRLSDAVHLQSSAEPAAQQVIVHLDLLHWQTSRFGGRGLGASDDLVANPHIATIGAHMDGAVHRLHRRMCEKGRLVDCFDFMYSPDHSLREVALLAGNDTGPLRGDLHLPQDVGA